MVENILLFFFILPIYGISFFSYFYPEDSFLFGKRWQFKEDPEISETGIKVIKFVSVIGILMATMILVFAFSDNFYIRISLVIGLIVYVIVRGIKLLPK